MMFHCLIEQMHFAQWVVSKGRWCSEGCSHPERLEEPEFPTLRPRQRIQSLEKALVEEKKMLDKISSVLHLWLTPLVFLPWTEAANAIRTAKARCLVAISSWASGFD